MAKKKLLRKKRGQSIVEFVLTLFAFLTVVFMLVQVSLGFAVSNYIHYATYMAARALLSGAETLSVQRDAAYRVIQKMLMSRDGVTERFKGIIKASDEGNPPGVTLIGPHPNARLAPNPIARDTAWEQGVAYKFKMKMYMLPIVKGSKRGKANSLELESETFLGRDPSSIDDCQKYMTQRNAIVDNGC